MKALADNFSLSPEPQMELHDRRPRGPELDEAEFKVQLGECLDDVQHEGTFTTFHTFSTFVNPGLDISTYGPVGLPLQVRDAEGIAQVCKQSPFGRGAETVIDTSVRQTWELDVNEFQCRNPAWPEYLNSLVNQAIEDLGVRVPTHAELYKLLLYKEGAFFKAHKDSEKVPGMFGTLVICLPSVHAGGEVHLTHSGKKRSFPTAPTSSYDISVLAWYSDVKHEVLPITAGYRLVLTYNLVQDQHQPRQTASALDESHARLEHLLRIWNDDFPYIDKVIYPLSHQYTPASISLRNLKGEDAAKGQYLEHLCSKNGAYWFLGRLTKQELDEDYCGYYEEDEEDSLTLDFIYTPTGERIDLQLRDVIEDDILAEVNDMYERNADSEDEGEFTGNEGMPSTFRYHDTVVIIMRKEEVIERFRKMQIPNMNYFQAFFNLVRSDRVRNSDPRTTTVCIDALKTLLAKIVNMLSKNSNDSYGSTRSWESSYYTTNREQNLTAATDMFIAAADFCHEIGLSDLVRQALQDALRRRDHSSSKQLYPIIAQQIAQEASSGDSDAWTKWLSGPLPRTTTYKYASENIIAFDIIKLSLPSAYIDSFEKWAMTRLEVLLRSVKKYDTEDVEPLLQIIPRVTPQTYSDIIFPTLYSHPHRIALSRFLCLMRSSLALDDVSQHDIIKSTYQGLLRIPHALKLSIEDLSTQSSPYILPEVPSTGQCMKELLIIVQQAIALGLHDETAQYLRFALPDLPNSEALLFECWESIFVFIQDLAVIIGQEDYLSLHEAARRFCSDALCKYVKSLAGRRPRQPTDWTRSRRNTCNCGPCQELTKFLKNGTLSVGRFSYAEKVRRHLEYSLPYGDYKFDTERGRTPYTLVVYKTTNEYTRLYEGWAKNVINMRKRLTELHSEAMTKVLGQSVHDLVRFEDVLQDRSTEKSQQPLQPTSASAQNLQAQAQVSSVQGKSQTEVIDLT